MQTIQEEKIRLRMKRSLIGHDKAAFSSPLTISAASMLLRMSLSLYSSYTTSAPHNEFSIPNVYTAVDLGCGRGKFLDLIRDECFKLEIDFSALGVDNDLESIECFKIAQKCPCPNVQPVTPGRSIGVGMDIHLWLQEAAASLDEVLVLYDLIICVGALPEGRQAEYIFKLSRLLRPVSGCLSLRKEDYLTSEQFKVAFIDSGLELQSVENMYDCDLDTYEDMLYSNVLAWSERPASCCDPDMGVILAAASAWNKIHTSWGSAAWRFAVLLGRRM